jgi:hypothetical protein
MHKPEPGEYAQSPYVSRYIEQVGDAPVLEVLARQFGEMTRIFGALDEAKSAFRYAEGKWSLKELLGHMVDTERIMAYRVLCIARGEKQPLPGFDENAYAQHAGYGNRPFADVLEEYRLVRGANLLLFGSFTEPMLREVGNANGYAISARAMLYVLTGHEAHHLSIIRERYLVHL